ncbi:hypothetical protein LshimejAT787_1202410 [Lyophyllum shimeji]|uniref:Uncharacterized protein n=1 Tax=Lyophyllum shimeji TaxID=47721 RepID=A0A9P3US17_LYOSH|nr:hypothetical protein LshimejAT787_1202410 [Lyophyllum shimeji]
MTTERRLFMVTRAKSTLPSRPQSASRLGGPEKRESVRKEEVRFWAASITNRAWNLLSPFPNQPSPEVVFPVSNASGDFVVADCNETLEECSPPSATGVLYQVLSRNDRTIGYRTAARSSSECFFPRLSAYIALSLVLALKLVLL